MIRSCAASPLVPSPWLKIVRGLLGGLRRGLRNGLQVGLATALLALAAPVVVAADVQVGQVSLLIGDAKVVRQDGSAATLRSGAAILVGDRIETSANGHVHVRFVDKAMVSVRPDSVLEVQAYHYDANNPQANEVRLKVAQGVSRSISGAATEVDKSRFRLNTPIAAIGVRGTDFIVQASKDDVRATVAAGAIVLSPLGNGCSAEGLGPCSGRAAQLLSADMGRLMVELRSGDRVPRVVPAVEALLASGTTILDHRAMMRAVAIAAAQPSLSDPRTSANDHAAAQLLAIAPLGPFDARALATPADRNAQMAWGRWGSSPDPFPNTSMSFAEASKDRQVTIIDSANALLFRVGPGFDGGVSTPDFASTNATRVDFRLTRAQAVYDNNGRSEAASVDGGTLSLDFLNRRFATALAVSSETGGKAELRIGGEVRANGFFSVADATAGQRVVGAVSLDTKEAGYYFERSAGGGLFRGRTLWGR